MQLVDIMNCVEKESNHACGSKASELDIVIDKGSNTLLSLPILTVKIISGQIHLSIAAD